MVDDHTTVGTTLGRTKISFRRSFVVEWYALKETVTL